MDVSVRLRNLRVVVEVHFLWSGLFNKNCMFWLGDQCRNILLPKIIFKDFSKIFLGKKINRVACGSAHSLAWSTNKPVNAGRLPQGMPMEYNHLNSLDIYALRNRLVLLHHFSDLFCPSIAMFDLEHSMAEKDTSGSAMGLDLLRGVLVSSAKVSWNVQCQMF